MTTLEIVPLATAAPAPAADRAATRPVLVVSPDRRVRGAVAALVLASAHLELSAQAASGVEARDLLDRDRRRHTVVVDLDVAVLAGPLALVADLAGLHDVVVLSSRAAVAVSARSAGAFASVSTVAEVEQAISSPTPASDAADGAKRHTGGAAPRTRPMSPGDLATVLLAVFLPPWVFWFSAIARDAGIVSWRLPQGAALWSMAVPLVAVVGWRFGRAGLADLAARVVQWRVPMTAYGAALAGPVVLGAAAVGIAMALGAPNPTGQVLSAGPALGYLVTGTGVFLLTEELAWRGVLLPRLLVGRSPSVAALLLGAIWAVWHLPLLRVGGVGDAGLPVVGFMVLVVATSVLMTAVSGLGRGSVLVAALAHAALDASYSWFGVVGPNHRVFWATVAVTLLAAVLVVAATRGRLLTARIPGAAAFRTVVARSDRPDSRRGCVPDGGGPFGPPGLPPRLRSGRWWPAGTARITAAAEFRTVVARWDRPDSRRG